MEIRKAQTLKRTTTTIMFCLFAFAHSMGQTLTYDVIRNGDSMGTTIVTRSLEGNKADYHLNTQTEFRILMSFEVEYDLKETFNDGVLVSGTSFNTLNGSEQKRTKMTRDGDHYSLVIDGIRTTVSEKAITNSVSEIYFEEPYDGKKVYSAYFARYLTFDKIGEHAYALSSPDGTNEYRYENGICVRVDVERDFANFHFELKPESLSAVKNKKILANQ